MEDKQLNEQESLQLITRMIRNTRDRMERNAGMPFIIMGYCTALVAVTVWFAWSTTQNANWNYLWFIIPLVGLANHLWSRNKREKREVTTYVDRVIGYIWNTLAIVVTLLSIYSIFVPIPILFVVILLMGLGTALTGLITRFWPCTIAGMFSIVLLAPLCMVVGGIDSILIFAAVFVVMMVIPGHILNYRSNHQQK